MKRPTIFIFLLAAFTAFADVVPWPIVQGSLSGHVHPSLARTKDGTLVVVFQGKGMLMRSRLKPGAENWEAARPIPGLGVTLNEDLFHPSKRDYRRTE